MYLRNTPGTKAASDTHAADSGNTASVSSLTRPPWSHQVRVPEMPRCYGYRQTPGARKLPATPRPLWQPPFCHSPNRKRKLRDPCASTHKPCREHLEEENRDPTAITGLSGSTGNGLVGNRCPGWERRSFCGLWSGGDHSPTGTRIS